MTNLACNVETCIHNCENLCCKSGIEVGGESAMSSASTCCESYEEKTQAFTSYSETPSVSTEVGCEAQNCTYNENCKCHADSINISGPCACSEEGTECASFVPEF